MSEPQYLTPREYAELNRINYRTAIRQYHEGLIPGHQTGGTIRLDNPNYHATSAQSREPVHHRAILYARVSSTVNKPSLDGQIKRLRDYASAKGYQIVGEYKEIASGLNDNRTQFNKVLKRNDYDILLVEHRDRLTRFGWNIIKLLLNEKNVQLESINTTDDKDEELVQDLIAIITSYCGKIYGRNRKKKTQTIINQLTMQETKSVSKL